MNQTLKTHLLLLACLLTIVVTSSVKAADIMTVRVQAGRVQEYENGSMRRSYGSDIVDVATDGELVAAVTQQGRIQEYIKGSLRRSYGSDVLRVRVSGGSVFADLKNGRTAEYTNGVCRELFDTTCHVPPHQTS